MQNGGGAGHVAVVESIDASGNVTVSEMNYYGGGGGWARISYRTLDAGAAAAYNFIK
jgi:surface antigen